MKISLIGIVLLAIGTQATTTALAHSDVGRQSRCQYAGGVASSKSSYFQDKNSARPLPPLTRGRRNEEAERFYNLGTRNALSGQYEEAVKNFTQAIELNSAYADAYFSLGNVYAEFGHWAEAIRSYKRSIHLNPKDGEAHNNLGVSYLKLGSPKQAVAAFKEAIRIFPTWAEPHFNLSTAYSKLEQTGEAAASYRKAILLRPDYSSRATLETAQTQTTDVVPQRDISNSNNNTASTKQLDAKNEAGKSDVSTTTDVVKSEKTSVVKSDIPVKSNSAKTFYNLGVKYGRAGRYRESVEAFEQAINLKPNYIDAYYGLGHAYSDLGRFKEAISAYEKVLELDSKDEEAYTRIGQLYAKLRAQTAANDSDTKEAAADNNASNSVATNAAAPPIATPAIAAPAAAASNTAPTTSVEETKTNANTSAATPQADASSLPVTDGEASKIAVSAAQNGTNGTLAKHEVPLSKGTDAAKSAPTSTNAATISAIALDVKDPTSIYRVGRGDVLDIHLLNAKTQQPTLFTITGAGLLEYSLIGEPMLVAGLTTDEIGVRLESELKLRAIQENPKVTVGVREYSSHSVFVSGLINEPGEKVLQREAIPLYVVIADAQPRPEAGQAVIISHDGGQRTIADLTDSRAMGKLVFPGDVINVEKKAKQFFYIGGNVRVPGQKDFHPGITLTQAVLGAGRKLSDGGNVNVTRQNESGLLATTAYSLKSIVAGKTPDPPVQPNDRIEVAP